MTRREDSGRSRGTQYEYPEDGYLNYSQLAEWLKCQYRWSLSRVRGIRSRKAQRALDIGSAVHYGIAAGITKFASSKKLDFPAVVKASTRAIKTWMADAIASRGGVKLLDREEHEMWEHINANVFGIARRGLENIGLEYIDILKHPHTGAPLVEHSFQVSMPGWTGWKGFHFTPDLVLFDSRDKLTWIWDYKVRQQFTPVVAEEVNMQFGAYQHGLAEVGIEVAGSKMFQLASRIPAVPKLNQNGTMSRQQISSTWEVYRDALLEAGLDPVDYLDMKDKLTTEFWRTTAEHRSKTEVQAMWDTFCEAAFQMSTAVVGAKGRLIESTVRSGMFSGIITCNGCWAREFCLGEMREDDIDFLLKTGYVDTNNPQERLILGPGDVVFE